MRPEFARLLDDLQARPWDHDFFALMRRVDALHPEAPRTGAARRPQQEALRLAQQVELDFAPAPIAALQPRPGAAPRLAVRFFGLLGPHGPLPLHLAEYVRNRRHQHGDHAPAHFLDLFNHRLLGLFYRAWAEAQPVVQRDRPHDDRYAAWLKAAAGLPAPAALPAEALAFHAGMLATRSRDPQSLVKVLSHHFGVPVAVEANVGHWLAIDARDRSRLGHATSRAARHRLPAARLGVDANAGSRAWDRQCRFRLRLGPLTLRAYRSFLPGGGAHAALVEWVGLLAGPGLQWELELDLDEAEKPAPRPARGVQLGVTSWLAPRKSGGAAAARRPTLRLRPQTSFLSLHPPREPDAPSDPAPPAPAAAGTDR